MGALTLEQGENRRWIVPCRRAGRRYADQLFCIGFEPSQESRIARFRLRRLLHCRRQSVELVRQRGGTRNTACSEWFKRRSCLLIDTERAQRRKLRFAWLCPVARRPQCVLSD